LSQEPDVIRVVSVSLGSSTRNKTVDVEMLGRKMSIERIGVDGDYGRAREMIQQLDGQVAAFGMGGTDLYLVAGGKRYVIRESKQLAEAAKQSPIVDGSGLKNTLERETVKWLAARDEFDLANKRVLVVSAVDRFGMAEGFDAIGCETIYGDLIFGLGLPIPVRSLRTMARIASVLLPVLCRLPIKYLYPTGDEQETTRPKHVKYFEWADVVAGDFHFIRRNLPENLTGKMVLTNTTTAADVDLMRGRGLEILVTTTPEFDGRSFGTNVMEAALIALAGKEPAEAQPEDYLGLLEQLGWEPRVERLRETQRARHP